MAEINLINQETAVIDDGLPYKVVRNSIPNASYLGTKGDLFIGTGESNDITIGGDTYKLTKMGKLSVPTLSADDVGEYILATDSSADNKITWVSNTIIFESTNNKIQFIKDCLKLDEAQINPSGKLGIMAGNGAFAVGSGTIAIGTQANVGSSNGKAYEHSIAIGSYTLTAGDYSIVMGSNAESNGSYNVVIGVGENSSNYTHADAANSVVIGRGASSDANETITIGANSTSTGSTSGVLVGTTFSSQGSEQKKSSVLKGNNSVAIGVGVSVTGEEAIGITTSIDAQSQGDEVTFSSISGVNSIGIGSGVTASAYSAIVIGTQSKASAASAIAIGNQAIVEDEDGYAIAIGTFVAASKGAIAIGSPSYSSQEDVNTTAQGQNSIAIGVGAQSVAQEAIAIGVGAIANNGIQLGTGTNNTSDTLQVYGWPLLDRNGQVPKERLPCVIANITLGTATVEATGSGYIENFIKTIHMVLNCDFNVTSMSVGETRLFASFDKQYAPKINLKRSVYQSVMNTNNDTLYEITGFLTIKSNGYISFTLVNRTVIEDNIPSASVDAAMKNFYLECSWVL